MLLRWLTSMCLIGFLMYAVPDQGRAQTSVEDKHLEVALRMVGHQVLLLSGDSLSRVLPIVRTDNHYKIAFTSDLSVNPEDLVSIVDSVMNKADINERYILEVSQCDSNKVVYSFEMNDRQDKAIVPCRSRDLPKACYDLTITFFDDATALSGPHAITKERSENDHSSSSLWVFFSLAAVMVPIAVAAWRRQKRSGNDPTTIKLGQYHFDRKNAILIMKEQRTELTAKEADLLILLYESGNDTVKREEILQRVWEDEGDYIGRTLDVYVSKLRKKLQADPGIKIVNVRGVGYKLVIEGP